MFKLHYGAAKHLLNSLRIKKYAPHRQQCPRLFASQVRPSNLWRHALPTAVGVLLSSYALVVSAPFCRLDAPSKDISGKSIQALCDTSTRVHTCQAMFDSLVDKYFEVPKPERTEEQKKLAGYMAVLWLTNSPERGRRSFGKGGHEFIVRAAVRLAQRYTKSEDFDDYKSMMTEFAETENVIAEN